MKKNPEINFNKSSDDVSRYRLLNYEQTCLLKNVMETSVPIHGTGNFPTLETSPAKLIQDVEKQLEYIGVSVTGIRLNGSAATHVINEKSFNNLPDYKDLDIIFYIEDKTNSSLKSNILSASKLTSDLVPFNEDSGYGSSSESISSYPPSPSEPTLPQLKLVKLTNSSKSILYNESHLQIVPVSPKIPRQPNKFSNCFKTKFSGDCWEMIKDGVMSCLLGYLPSQVSKDRMSPTMLTNAYVQKKVKVSNKKDQWSLISLNNNSGRNLELKFVKSMNRQYEFSVDSFHIELKSFLKFRSVAPDITMTSLFYPTVVAESVYGNFEAALRHLKYQRICTFKPEEIRGGGLLRYCNLRARGFKPGDCSDDGKEILFVNNRKSNIEKMEQHMCSRFFIDFSSIQHQTKKLISYLENRFRGEEELKLEYLISLRRVVRDRTVCLMQHELNMFLNNIGMLIRHTLAANINASTINKLPVDITYGQQPLTSIYANAPVSTQYCNSYQYLAPSMLSQTLLSEKSSPISSARSSPEPFSSLSSRPSSTPPSSLDTGFYSNSVPPSPNSYHSQVSHQMCGHVCNFCGCMCTMVSCQQISSPPPLTYYSPQYHHLPQLVHWNNNFYMQPYQDYQTSSYELLQNDLTAENFSNSQVH